MSNHIRRLVLSCLAAALGWVIPASAQSFIPLHTFSTAAHFWAPMAQGPDGALYGVSFTGGLANDGTVFKLQPDGTGFAIIYSFTNGIDGSGPVAGLVVSGNTLYGTAKTGGSGGHGTVFKLNTDGSGFDPIYSFSPYSSGTNTDGASPAAALVLSDGVLYGTASAGGRGYGTVFKVNTDGSGFSTLWNFSGTVRSVDGKYPLGALLLSDSTLYGTTQEGGTNGYGTIFKIDTDGMNFATMHAFTQLTSSGTNIDGNLPVANLVLSGDTLYGTTSGGGAHYGTVFSVNIDGNSFANLYNFTNGVDGATPLAGLIITNNTLYGTTSSGGVFPGWGTVFKLGADGTGFTNLYDFPGNGDAVQPNAGLVLSGDTLVGTTLNYGPDGGGSVFKVNTNGTGFATLSYGDDGVSPIAGLTLSGDTLYGTTSLGGVSDTGTVFKVNTDGTGFAMLYSFSAASTSFHTNRDGSAPEGSLILSEDTLYGTASGGGTSDWGTIFKLNINGSGFTTLYDFTNGTDGANPITGLVLSGGTLYGTASGGSANSGTIFSINTNGAGFSNLYSFSAQLDAGSTNSDGAEPLTGLSLSGDTLYGAAFSGGPGGGGTLFKINTNGSGFTNIYYFNEPTRSDPSNAPDGANPKGRLTLSGNVLYGTATAGGLFLGGTRSGGTYGTVFRINTDGTDFIRLYAFSNNFDGLGPYISLALSGNTLYGATGGSASEIFQLNTEGSDFATLHTFNFNGVDNSLLGDLVTDGRAVYGTAEYSIYYNGLAQGPGVVFALNPAVTPSIQFTATPTTGLPPLSVTFNAPSVDSGNNSILYYHLDFGDGTAGTGSLPVTHIYATNGIFTPTFVATNVNGTVLAGTGSSIVVAFPTSIQNNGFETGTFTNWTASGNVGQTILTATNYVHSGAYGAQLRAINSFGYLSQIITTTPGDTYTVSFWLHSSSTRANEFQVSWDGSVIFDQTNIGAIGWTNIQLSVPATLVNTVLQFGYINNSSPYFGLDDISVTSGTTASSRPTIASANVTGGNLVLNCGGGSSSQTYYVFMGTNLLEPISQWIPVTTNAPGASGNFSITATNAVDSTASQRYFIIEAQ